MKKSFIISALALVALASCSKNQITPVIEDQEISFQTVVGSMSTKAANNTFPTTAGFYSWALQHQNAATDLPEDKLNIVDGNTWSEANGATQEYIANALIAHKDNEWKSTTSYYWPKASYLTFYAWADGKNATPVIDDVTPGFDKDKGIYFSESSYVISEAKNKNKDFMVAEVAYNQEKNTTAHGSWSKGVPTIFHHQLSSFAFKAKTDKNYEAETNKEHYFYVTKLTFKDVKNSAKYQQLHYGTWQSSWSAHSGKADFVMFNAENAPSGTVDIPGTTPAVKGILASNNATATDLPASTNEFTILLPQLLAEDNAATEEMEGAYVEIEYYAVDNINGTKVSKKYTAKKNLLEIFTLSWIQEYKYTLTVKFSLEEILWDPATEAWIDATSGKEVTI